MADTTTPTATPTAEPVSIERKQFSFAAQCKMLDEGDGGFEGIASPFGALDDADDIIVAGTYKETIPDFLRDGWVAADHKWGVKNDIGIYTTAEETDGGLRVVGEFHGTPDAQAIRAKVKKRLESKKSVKLSIGFVTLDSKSMPGKEAVKYLRNPTPQEIAYCESRAWVRVIFKVKLYEVSLVSVPAARAADVVQVKSVGGGESASGAEQKATGQPAAPPTPHTESKSVAELSAETATENKEGSVIGDWVPESMTCRAIGAVMDALWYLIYDCIYPWPRDTAPPIAERLAVLEQGWDEGKALVTSVITAILGDEAAETPEEAVETLTSWGVAALAERKSGKIEIKNVGASQVGVPLAIHSERVLAAATGLKDRLSSLRDLRLKEGRTFSQANCDRIEQHCKALDDVSADLRGMLAGAVKTTETSESDADGDEKNITTTVEQKTANPALQALIRSKYNAFMENNNV